MDEELKTALLAMEARQEERSTRRDKLFSEIVEELLDNKLGALRAELRAELGALRAELRAELGALRAELLDKFERVEELLDDKMGALRAELRGELGRLRGELLDKFERVENKLISMSEDMTVTMGAASVAMQQREGDRRDVAVFVGAVTLLQRKLARLQTDVEELQKKAS